MTRSISPESPNPTGPPPVPLAPGFRFHPTDEELVSYYLRRRINGRRLRLDAIAEVDLYRLEPWDLPPKSRIRSRDAEWYFFARLDRKLSGAGAGGRGSNVGFGRSNRATPNGYWKTTGKDRDVVHKGKIVGLKKTLVFHSGRAPKGQRTNWVMHEYRLLDVAAEADKDMYVVCRLFQKNGSGPQNAAQYGAPFVEEEWEEEEDETEMGSGGDLGQVTVAMLTGGADGEDVDEEVDQMGFFQMNDVTKNEDVVNPPEIAPFPAQGGGENYPENLTFSMEEIMQQPVSDGSIVEYADKYGEQTDNTGDVSLADWSCYASQNGPVVQDYLADPMNLNGLTNGGSTHWPLRSNSNQESVNGLDGGINLQEILDFEEFFNSANENNGPSEQPLVQANEMLAPSVDVHPGDQAEENMVFYDASAQNWVDGKHDFLNLDGLLHSSIPTSSMFNVEDDLMAYFDATENDIKYDWGSTNELESYDPQVTDASTVVQKVEDADGLAFNGPRKMQDANAMSGASSSVMPPEDLYSSSSKAKDFAGMSDDIVDKTFGKRLVSMLGSIPAPAALAAEYPVTMGKSIASVSPSTSSIRITAGMIQIDGLTFTGNTEHWPFQKNGDVDFLDYTIRGGVSTKSVDFDPVTTMHGGAISLMLHGGFYLVFVSTMILALSYKIGLCMYGR